MVVQIEFPELEAPARIFFDGKRFDHEAYWNFCVANPSVRSELNAHGEIIIVPPAGGESSYQSLDVASQLFNWARADGRGKSFDSSGGFILPSGAVSAPDAAWVSNARLETLTKRQRQKFIPLAPEFVIEVMSPKDTLPVAQGKMEAWIAGGVELGWLIDPKRRAVLVYRIGAGSLRLNAPKKLAGEGPIEGFLLELQGVWAGL